jgi:hypothetical protein
MFTINNYQLKDCQRVTALLLGPDVILGCAECEVGQSGTPRIQGFVHLNCRVRLNQCWMCSARERIANPAGDRTRSAPKRKRSPATAERRPDHGAAQTLSTEDFVRSYPEEWLQHRQTLEKIMLAAAQARAAVWDGDLHQKNV